MKTTLPTITVTAQQQIKITTQQQSDITAARSWCDANPGRWARVWIGKGQWVSLWSSPEGSRVQTLLLPKDAVCDIAWLSGESVTKSELVESRLF
jgi:hypothetical protein